MSWKPDHESLTHVCLTLQNAVSSDAQLRQQALDALDSFKLQPEFANYLCFILIHLQEMDQLKGTAGILLKNCILSGQVSDLQYVKAEIVNGLCLPNKFIVKITGIVIAALFSTYYRQHREDPLGLETINKLLQLAKENNEGSMRAFSKMMEDGAQFFQLPWSNNQVPIGQMINIFLFLMIEGKSEIIRAESVKCINNIIPLNCQELLLELDLLLQNIFQLAQSETSPLVRQQLCQCLVLILEFRPDKLSVHLEGIVQFMVHLIVSSDRDDYEESRVALEACEFLLALVSNTNVPVHLIKQFVGTLVPVLLNNMVYDHEQILLMEASNEADADDEDKDEDIKPMSAKIRKTNGENAEADDDVDERNDDDVNHEWNLRKCAASTLDLLTNILPKDVITTALPLLREHLTSNQWFVTEATTLSLGAMAEGGIKYFESQLPALIPFLVEQLKNPWFPVRRITCWTLSRFSRWILDDHSEFLIPVLEPLLEILQDKKKDVQEAAITSVATFIENCDPEIVYTILYNPLLEKFDQCFRFYQKKNLIILYDAVSRLSEKCDFDEQAMNKLLPHLLNKWSMLDDSDKELWPLLECLSYVSVSLGSKFVPMAPDVYHRAYSILCRSVDLEAKSHTNPAVVPPEKDFMITSLDLIDGIVQALGPESKELLFPNNDLTLLLIILQCLQDYNNEVRQSAYALVGDIAYFYEGGLFTPELASQFIGLVSTELVQNIENNEAVSTVNNCIWALGLISHKIDISPHILDISRILLDLFCSNQLHLSTSIVENICITISRLSYSHPEVFAQPPFATERQLNKWCTIASKLSDTEEKSIAYGGFMRVLNLLNISNDFPSTSTWNIFFEGLQTDVDASLLREEFLPLVSKLPEHWKQLLLEAGIL